MMNPTTSKPNLFDQAPAMSFPDQASLDELRADITPRIFAFIFLIGLATSIFVQELPGVIAPRVLALLLMGATQEEMWTLAIGLRGIQSQHG